jgi:anhydro-N-acetylmuramic acid kinase
MISGTSRDGVDTVLVSFEDKRPEILYSMCVPYPPDLADSLKNMIENGQRPAANELEKLDDRLADFFSQAVQALLGKAEIKSSAVTAIGSHGQTVWHDPAGTNPESIQLGNPQRITGNTGIVTIGDFRRADIEAGGQGAPLAPLLHRALFKPESGTRIVLNLGGIANISILNSNGSVSGFDTGPANCLLDAWIREQRGESYDKEGAWSAGGTVNKLLLLNLLMDPWFKKPPPKSTGVEHFNLQWLKQQELVNTIDPRDVQATLAQLTVSTIASAAAPFNPADILVCGGGVHNTDLVRRLQDLLPGIPILSTANQGLDPDWVEAVLIAWLARERLAGNAQDTRKITGARQCPGHAQNHRRPPARVTRKNLRPVAAINEPKCLTIPTLNDQSRELDESPVKHHLVDTGRLHRRHRLPAGRNSALPDDHRHPFRHPVFQTGGPGAYAFWPRSPRKGTPKRGAGGHYERHLDHSSRA